MAVTGEGPLARVGSRGLIRISSVSKYPRRRQKVFWQIGCQMREFSRLFAPRSIAVVGGGTWCASIIGAARRIGYDGDIFPVHPDGKEIAGLKAFRNLKEWPGVIDAAFIGVNRNATLKVIEELSRLGAGGAVSFASGFSEAQAEDAGADALQEKFVHAAGEMPVLGPNCYGFINALDCAAIWPDQHGMTSVERGVAILTQSSNIAINLTMQRRGLPIGYMVTCGNMAQTSQAQIAMSLTHDPRVTAIGFHIEGFGDLSEWQAFAAAAYDCGIPVVALKVGSSDQARAATVSHTASLAGSDTGAQALMARLGFARVDSLGALLETLKLLHCEGPLSSNRIASISCSGGEASLVADMAQARGLVFPDLTGTQKSALRQSLGPMVALANPLDYHTYIWRDSTAMGATWSAMTGDDIAMTLSVVDYPHTDNSDWACATEAAIAAKQTTKKPFGVVASLPELMPSDIADKLMQSGVVPFHGLEAALDSVRAAGQISAPSNDAILPPGNERAGSIIDEAEAKRQLAAYGVPVPNGHIAVDASGAALAASNLSEPLVLKGLGAAHKTEAGLVQLYLSAEDVGAVARAMPAEHFLVEEMVADGVAELLVGVMRDEAHGFVLTVGMGGTLTEIVSDTASLLVPSPRKDVRTALLSLKCAPLLSGYRGKPGADIEAILSVIESLQSYVIAHADSLNEIEINPLMCTPNAAIAVDALIRKEAK